MIRDFATLKNRTTSPVTFTYGGEQRTIKPEGKLTVDLDLARFLFTCDQVLGVTEDGQGGRRAVYKLGIDEGPDSLLEALDTECFDCTPVTIIPSREHPDLAANRSMKELKVGGDPSDFKTHMVAVR